MEEKSNENKLSVTQNKKDKPVKQFSRRKIVFIIIAVFIVLSILPSLVFFFAMGAAVIYIVVHLFGYDGEPWDHFF